MSDRGGFLSLDMLRLRTTNPCCSDDRHIAIPLHSDEHLQSSSPLQFRAAPHYQSPAAVEAAVAVRVDTPRLPPSPSKGKISGGVDCSPAQTPPLQAFFSVDPHRAAATVFPAEEDALTQRRWRADAAEVDAFLTRLDLAREECAAAGLYIKAQSCVLRMEQALRLFAERLHAETDAVALRTRERMTEQYRRERLDLRKRWRDKVLSCRQDAAALIAATEQHYDAQLAKEDVAVRADLRRDCGGGDTPDKGSAGPSWPKEVPHLQMELHQYLRQRRYRDAERVRVQLQRLKRQEASDHQRGVTQRHAQRLQAINAAWTSALVEMQAAQREEVQGLVLAGRAALDELTNSHLAALQSAEDRCARLHARAREILREHKHADVVDPKATGLKLIRLSQLLWAPPSAARR
ncbi:hypothetical protein ABL78_3173 [Leptomonas seymouri]|uniref:Uncharacterized protein n=1 Tax=Leptomonas seymouri TaxID=5684 RepID=A0A0N1PEW3_LEPSE|nr:hypothetical protein ABL78_3173 [Leptomonas seymouri]|eukprot:KPI87764.1 hypothetical protein ABL78_3173 [Leptomonas seymouri]